jgi:UDP-GlcNAc:undecaprenyl-phosphate/decaprenyl-phosphate GlcNAc-1-phosphate transferase
MDSLPAPLAQLERQAPLAFTALGFVLAAVLALAFSIVVRRLCLKYKLLDRPNARKVHRRPIPRLGGIAIFLAFVVVSMLLYRPVNAYEGRVYIGLLAAAVVTVAVMAWDDIRGLPPLLRLGVQTLAAFIAIYPAGHGTLIEVIHNPLITENNGQTPLPLWIAVIFTWFWIVGMMNTINWVDGLDGLAAGVVTITALVMALISWLLGQQTAALLCAILAGATLGFLPLNWHPARLFMGDSGAMFLGLALAVLSNVGGAKLATMLLLLGLPILDTSRVILRRMRAGRSPLRFDTSHLHHRLLAGGLSQRQIVLIFYAVTAIFGSVTILGAYLEIHAGTVRLQSERLPWLNVAVSELPTLLGLAAVVLVSVGIWSVAYYRRKRTGLPPGASFAHLASPSSPSASTPREASPTPTPTASGPLSRK